MVPKSPLSFVCVKQSKCFEYNINVSEAIHGSMNEFIVIDNTDNIYFSTHSEAINEGVKKASNDLIVIVDEKVTLPSQWLQNFEKSLLLLESRDPNWLIIGMPAKCLGKRNVEIGGQSYLEAGQVTQQVMVLRKKNCLFPDSNLPGVQSVSQDLSLEVHRRNGKIYLLDSEVMYMHRNASGEVIASVQDLPRERYIYAHNADLACSNEYMVKKWQKNHVFKEPVLSNLDVLESPVILLAKGGGGSRFLSVLADDVGLFLGKNLNVSGDQLDMVNPIYRALIRKYKCPDVFHDNMIVPDIKATAAELLKAAGGQVHWGFKLPESLLILPELQAAFPKARYIYLRRDPLATVLRRTHLTARLDNQIGQITLPLAYRFFNLEPSKIQSETEVLHMARTTVHQLSLVNQFKINIAEDCWLDLRFEDLIDDPSGVLNKFAEFLSMNIQSSTILEVFDANRATTSHASFSNEIIREVEELLQPIRSELGYQ